MHTDGSRTRSFCAINRDNIAVNTIMALYNAAERATWLCLLAGAAQTWRSQRLITHRHETVGERLIREASSGAGIGLPP
jgi:hypothetical protein